MTDLPPAVELCQTSARLQPDFGQTSARLQALPVCEAYPVAPSRTRDGMTTCFPAETVARPDFDERVQHYYRRLDAAIDEDIPALENQQLGLSSPFARQGRYSWLEPSVASFARWYAERLLDEAD